MWWVLHRTDYLDGTLFTIQNEKNEKKIISEPTLMKRIQDVGNATTVLKLNTKPYVRLKAGTPTKEVHKPIPKMLLNASPTELNKAREWFIRWSRKSEESVKKSTFTPFEYVVNILKENGFGDYIVKTFSEAYSNKRRKNIVVTDKGTVYVTFKVHTGYDEVVFGSFMDFGVGELRNAEGICRIIRGIKDKYEWQDAVLNSRILAATSGHRTPLCAYGDSHDPSTKYDGGRGLGIFSGEALAVGKDIKVRVLGEGEGLSGRKYDWKQHNTDAPVLTVRIEWGECTYTERTNFDAFTTTKRAEELAELILQEIENQERELFNRLNARSQHYGEEDEFYVTIIQEAVKAVARMNAHCVGKARPLDGTW